MPSEQISEQIVLLRLFIFYIFMFSLVQWSCFVGVNILERSTCLGIMQL